MSVVVSLLTGGHARRCRRPFLFAQRKNHLDHTYYFDKKYELTTCTNEVRTALLEMCAEAEKIPGINVDHWPWQGHSLNLNRRGFSGDWMLGPYGWSGRNKHSA